MVFDGDVWVVLVVDVVSLGGKLVGSELGAEVRSQLPLSRVSRIECGPFARVLNKHHGSKRPSFLLRWPC